MSEQDSQFEISEEQTLEEQLFRLLVNSTRISYIDVGGLTVASIPPVFTPERVARELSEKVNNSVDPDNVEQRARESDEIRVKDGIPNRRSGTEVTGLYADIDKRIIEFQRLDGTETRNIGLIEIRPIQGI